MAASQQGIIRGGAAMPRTEGLLYHAWNENAYLACLWGFGSGDAHIVNGDSGKDAGLGEVADGKGRSQISVLSEQNLGNQQAAGETGFDAQAFRAEIAVRRGEKTVRFPFMPGGRGIGAGAGGHGENTSNPKVFKALLMPIFHIGDRNPGGHGG
jgi:hypothetical protein